MYQLLALKVLLGLAIHVRATLISVYGASPSFLKLGRLLSSKYAPHARARDNLAWPAGGRGENCSSVLGPQNGLVEFFGL